MLRHSQVYSQLRYTYQMRLGIVVIGRNEGSRLVTCLSSLQGYNAPIVYVDSNSTDGSPDVAARMGAAVVRLDLSRPFTAGRARNEGFFALTAQHPDVQYVQFVDGDCEVELGWLPHAQMVLEGSADIGAVCGRRRERNPGASIYNHLCDLEWNTPVGEAMETGGDFMVRASAFSECGGFNGSLIAGEDPELGYRLRKLGYRIVRLDHPMTVHDASIFSLRQWAKRSSRAGYAYAARALLHIGDQSHYCWRENARIFFWGILLPALITGAALLVSPWCLLIALAYPLQILRLAQTLEPTHAFFLVIAKWPESFGQMLFLYRWVRGKEERIIEYK